MALACWGCAAEGAPETLEGGAGASGLATSVELALALEPGSQLSLEEDYAYPEAEKYRPSGIELKQGDGHLLIVDCASPDATVTVESFMPSADFCFQVRGPRAYLSMELTGVYLITVAQRGLSATVSLPNGQRRSVPLTPGLNPIGYADGSDDIGATLLELRLSP